jgi:hypothetical protein
MVFFRVERGFLGFSLGESVCWGCASFLSLEVAECWFG